MYTSLKKSEFPLLRSLGRDLNYFLDRFGFGEPFAATETFWAPALEVFEKGNELFVKAELPGLKKEDVTLDITDSELTIKGERKMEKEEKEKGYYRTELSYGSFYRSIPLPEGAKIDLAKATMKDGVLEVRLPIVRVEATKRHLEIQAVGVGEKTGEKGGEKGAKHAA